MRLPGAQNETPLTMNRRKFIATAGAGAASLALAGCTGEEGNGGQNEEEPGETPQPGDEQITPADEGVFDLEEGEVTAEETLKVTMSSLFKTEDEGAGVMGTVKNTGEVPYTYVEAQATLYDETDDVLGEFFDNTEEEAIDDLGAGEIWQFSIFFDRADLGEAASYSINVFGDKLNEADGEAGEGEEPAGNETGGGNGTSGNESAGNESGSA